MPVRTSPEQVAGSKDFTRLHHSSSLPCLALPCRDVVVVPNTKLSHKSILKTTNSEQGEDLVLAMSGEKQSLVVQEVRLKHMCEH